MTNISPMPVKDERKAVYLLADSQLLFWQQENNPFITSLRQSLAVHSSKVTKAAYIGASNGDDADYYELFIAAMDNIDTHECRQIYSSFDDSDRAFLEQADLIVLAGGDCYAGWQTIDNKGMAELIAQKYYSGCVLLGVSAGAVQLGLGSLIDNQDGEFYSTLKVVPYYLDVHNEHQQWRSLRQLVQQQSDYSKGYGIGSGGGMIFHPDATIEPLRTALCEFDKTNQSQNQVVGNILLPPTN